MIDTSNVIDFINVRVAGDDGSPRMHKVGVLHKEWVEIEGKSYLFAIHLHTTTAKGYTATHWVSGLALCHGGTPEETVINLHNRVLMGQIGRASCRERVS